MRILAFDTSSGVTGWALIKSGREISVLDYGHFETKSKKGKTLLPMGERLALFKENILPLFNGLIGTKSPYVAVEEHHVHQIKAAKTLMKFMGVFLLIAYEKVGNRIIEISPRKVRTELGVTEMKRDPAKKAIRRIVEKMFGIKVNCFDESDAIAVGIVAAGQIRLLGR